MSLLRIKYERIKRHWTQHELARRSGIRIEPLGLIENGRLQPTEEQLLRLANALKITPPEVLLKPTVLADEAAAERLIADREGRSESAPVGR